MNNHYITIKINNRIIQKQFHGTIDGLIGYLTGYLQALQDKMKIESIEIAYTNNELSTPIVFEDGLRFLLD